LPSNRASSDKESHGGAKDPRDEITWPGKRRRPHGKIGFENLAKEIGARWKNIDEETKEHYKKLALEDLQRYSRRCKSMRVD
jgi:HMG (high mobility group) box.